MLNRLLLTPLSWIYVSVTSLRNLLFDAELFKTYKSNLPVISVGNLSAGGNGKTPLCLHLAKTLREQGREPVILTRGYKSKVSCPYHAKQGDSAELIGDEACLYLQEDVPVVISPSRVEGAKLIEAERIGDLIILDDGFQHRWLARDLDILTVDVSTSSAIEHYIEGDVLPLGLFRESKSRALERADVVVFSTRRLGKLSVQEQDLLKADLPFHLKYYFANLHVLGVISASSDQALSEGPVVAFCGLAQPEGFFQTLESLGFDIVDKVSFADHHSFSPADIQRLQERYPNTPLVCTAKDIVKVGDPTPNLYVLSTGLELDRNLLETVGAISGISL